MIQIDDFLKYLESHELKRVESGSVVIDDAAAALLHVAINPGDLSVSVSSRDTAVQMVVVRDGEGELQPLNIDVARGATINVVELLWSGAQSSLTIVQSGDSVANLTQVELASAVSRCRVALNGCGASVAVDVLQLLSGDQRGEVSLRIEHNSGDCSSNSTSKCVANDRAQGLFDGLIYVAQDAQHTVANQNSRNVALSDDVRIKAEPQLEIYADDVMCTHGATVGQMNQEAVYYMRQRGLSEAQARKIQLEGFVADISQRCCIESLREGIEQLLGARLEEL
ncbi:MAG: SufD family Fe-S cluster assembly protein [Rikenellaceae bacterium]